MHHPLALLLHLWLQQKGPAFDVELRTPHQQSRVVYHSDAGKFIEETREPQ